MRKLLIILFLLFTGYAEASPPSRSFTYTTGSVISSSQVTANEDSIFNYLQAGVDAYSDGTIVNADVHSSANIQSDKLNLTAIAQSVANSGSTTLTGTFAANGTTNSIGNGGSDVLTLNVPGGMTLSAATTWTLTGALTFSGTIADLGTVTTANIDGGTMDGVQIGGTTATGELIVNDASDDADGLGSQGTSGQLLQSAGAGANPTWVDGMVLLSTTAISSNNSGDITIAASKLYKVVISLINISADDTVKFRINSDTGSSYTDVVDGNTTYITVGQMEANSTSKNVLTAEFILDTRLGGSTGFARVFGNVLSFNSGTTALEINLRGGSYQPASGSPTSFEIYSSGGATLTGSIYLYQIL